MVHCLLIEDDSATRGYLAAELERAGYAVTAAHDGAAADRLLQERRWDVVLLDRLLPGVSDGLSLLAAMRGRGEVTPVLVLSALGSVDERVRGLRAGGDDYLVKPFALVELLARIDNLVRRAASTEAPGELRVKDLVLDLRAGRVWRGERRIALQPREFRLLEYLMRHAGRVVTRAMLLKHVWDYDFDPQTNVIDVHVSRLRGKIDKGFDEALIRTVRGAGYVLKGLTDEDSEP